MLLWEGFWERRLTRHFLKSLNQLQFSVSQQIHCYKSPWKSFSTYMSPPISSIIIPLLRVSIISTSQDSIISLGSHYAGGHMQPYVAHRPPPCGVTLVIMRSTQSQTRRKAQNSSSWRYFLWYYLSLHYAHQGIPAFEPPAFHPTSPPAKNPPADGDLIPQQKPNEHT